MALIFYYANTVSTVIFFFFFFNVSFKHDFGCSFLIISYQKHHSWKLLVKPTMWAWQWKTI